MKTYKQYAAAKKAANGLPIIKIEYVGDVLFVVHESNLDDYRLTEVSLITPDGKYAGHITMVHLDRLGNGNYAEAKRPIHCHAFPDSDAENLPGVGLCVGRRPRHP